MADLRIVDAPEIPTENITGEEKLPTGGSGNYSITLDSVADYTKTKKDLADNTAVDSKVNVVRQELNTHTEDLLNPHQVTKEQIGLCNVDNTADADKPVSNSTQAAIISAVFPKSDKTYVDTQDSSLQLQINQKAETEYVNIALSNLSTEASKFYPTLTEANADIANLAVNQVVNIGEVANGGLWHKATAGATSLTKSAYDPLTQAKADATTKANAAQAAAINAAATDATTKANAAEANAKSYAENVAAIQSLSGTDIYYRSKDNPARLFQAIWQEYNKPVWYIGNSTFVDTTGATLSMVETELVFTIKLTEANQTFIYPTRPTGTQTINATIDWGDGIVASHTNYNISHAYVGNIGDEFQIKLKGVMPEFDFGAGNAGRRTSRLMLKSVDKNTMPKVMTFFDLAGCTNLVYLCRGAYSSWNNGSTFSPKYAENSPNIIFHPKAFEGLESVTDISGIFGRAGYSINFDIPAGLLDVFANATIASYAFYGLAKPLPVGILDKLINLEDVSYMFNIASITSIDNRIFKNQTKLKNVSNCFRQASSLVANAHQLYTDMNQGLPTIVNGCFLTASAMTNLASVPAGWKA